MALAHKLAMQLRAAEDRIIQLEAEVSLFRDRVTRAEGWLQTIHSEIEQKLMTPLLIDMREIAQRNEIEHADIASPAATLGCSRMNEFWRD
jgi:hypothetical protein